MSGCDGQIDSTRALKHFCPYNENIYAISEGAIYPPRWNTFLDLQSSYHIGSFSCGTGKTVSIHSPFAENKVRIEGRVMSLLVITTLFF